MERNALRVALVLPDRSLRELLAESLFAEGFDVRCFDSAADVAAAVDGSERYVVLIDPSEPETQPDPLLSKLTFARDQTTRVILLGLVDVPPPSDSPHVVASIELPFDLGDLVRLIEKAGNEPGEGKKLRIA
jgi:DNA-binding NtrC family response regulator